MFKIENRRMRFDRDLQIIQADVKVELDGEMLIDESLCIDVGLPALMLSCLEPTVPCRWAPAEEWQRAPFFVCGCGDPECRAHSIRALPLEQEGVVEWTLVEESEDGTYREQETYRIPLRQYREQVLQAGERFLQFVEGLDYRPYMEHTVPVVRQLAERIRSVLSGEK